MNNIVNTKNKLALPLLIIFGVLLFIYTTARAYFLSITWDESQSYLEFIRHNIVLWNDYDFMSANNHLLNTLGGIVFTKWFGLSEFSLRISSLIAHAFFLFYSAKLVYKMENKWIALSAFLILNLNPFMLDFFSLARGYSISLGMMMASVFYLFELHTSGYRTKHGLLSILFAILGTLGNLTLLNYLVVLYGVIMLLLTYNNHKDSKRVLSTMRRSALQMLLPSIVLALFLWFMLPYSFKLKEAGALFMGGENGFWQDTVGSIVPRLWYHLDFSYWLIRITKIFFVVVLVSSLIYIGLKHAKGKTTNENMFLGSLLLLFLLIILFTLAQHYLLGTLYLIERAVLFLFVLLMLIFAFFVNELFKEQKFFQSILHVFALVVFVHFLFSFNLKYVYEWKDECDSKEMLQDLKQIKQPPKSKFNLSISMPLILESEINYYRVADTLTWLNQAIREKKIHYLHDYYFLKKDQYDMIQHDSLEVIKIYPTSGNILAKAKYPYTNSIIVFDSIIDFESTTADCRIKRDQEYSPAITYVLNEQTANSGHLVSVRYNVTAKQREEGNMYMLLVFENDKGAYVWLRPNLMDFIYENDKKTDAYFSYPFPASVKPGDIIKAFIWNPNKKELFLNQMEMRIIRYSRE